MRARGTVDRGRGNNDEQQGGVLTLHARPSIGRRRSTATRSLYPALWPAGDMIISMLLPVLSALNLTPAHAAELDACC